MIANTPESVAYNIYVNLAGKRQVHRPDVAAGGGLGQGYGRVFFARRTTEPPRRGKTNETRSVKHRM